MVYGELHKYFLRSLMAKGIMPEREAAGILHKFRDEDESLQEVIRSVNEKIQPFRQSIKMVVNEVTGESEVVFLSFGDDEASRAQGIYTLTELDYFRTILQDIVTSEHRYISFIAAVNAVTKINGSLSKTEAQVLLDAWCTMGYLRKTENKFGLGTRGIHEFETYIKTNIPSAVEQCGLCKQTVYQGYNCTNCGVAIHTRCLNKYLERIQKWPCCNADYDDSFQQTQTQQVEPDFGMTNDDITLAEEVMASIASETDLPDLSQQSEVRATRGRKRPRE